LPEVVEPARFSPFGAIREILNDAGDQALPAACEAVTVRPPKASRNSVTTCVLDLALGSE